MAKRKIKIQRTEKQRQAAIQNLAKARAAKKRYQNLRREGFKEGNVEEATEIVQNQLNRLSVFQPENNPAVAQLLAEVGGELPSADQLAEMTKSEYFRYATSLRTFINSPLSDENAINKLFDKVLGEIVGSQLTRKKGEKRTQYYRRRKQFIEEHSDTAKTAFELYRRLEETHAGVILRGKISPMAYGSDNLITDLFDFVENDYDGDLNMALGYWQEQLSEQYRWEEQESARMNVSSNKLSKFDWTGREMYASFVARHS